MYLNGQGVDADKQKAIDYFKKAAKLGSSSAKVNLAKCYLEGDGVKKNNKKAFELYMQAADEKRKPHTILLCYISTDAVATKRRRGTQVV